MRALRTLAGNFCGLLSVSCLVGFAFVVSAVPVSAIPDKETASIIGAWRLNPFKIETVFGDMDWSMRKHVIINDLSKKIWGPNIRHINKSIMFLCNNSVIGQCFLCGDFDWLLWPDYKMHNPYRNMIAKLIGSEEHIWIWWDSKLIGYTHFSPFNASQWLDEVGNCNQLHIFRAYFNDRKVSGLGSSNIYYQWGISPFDAVFVGRIGSNKVSYDNISALHGFEGFSTDLIACQRVGVLLAGGESGVANSRNGISVSAPNTVAADGSSNDESYDSKPFAKATRILSAILLATISLLLSRHAVYRCRYGENGGYIFFVLLSVLPMLGALFVLAPVLGM